MKSVLVDFLVSAGIKPVAIVSYNHLGNNDGKNLSEPQQFRSKEISKSNVVDDMVSSNRWVVRLCSYIRWYDLLLDPLLTVMPHNYLLQNSLWSWRASGPLCRHQVSRYSPEPTIHAQYLLYIIAIRCTKCTTIMSDVISIVKSRDTELPCCLNFVWSLCKYCDSDAFIMRLQICSVRVGL